MANKTLFSSIKSKLTRTDTFNEDREMVDYVADRIADAEAIRRSRQFPYQFLAAYLNASAEVPQKIKAALQQAAEIACGNVPEQPGPVVIGLDTSGSMSCQTMSRWPVSIREKSRIELISLSSSSPLVLMV